MRAELYRGLLVASAVVGVAMCFLPRLSVHGVESALFLGVLWPPMASVFGARLSLATRARVLPTARLLGRSVALGLGLLLVPVALLAVNALRVRNCAPLQGLTFIALGPGAGVVLAGLCGSLIGSLPGRPRLLTWLAALLPLLPIALALYRFYATPGIFAYGHFFGYYPGTLYDEVVGIPEGLWTLRSVTLAWAVAVVAVTLALRDPASGQLSFAISAAARAPLAIALLSSAVALVFEVRAPALGHVPSTTHIEAQLSGLHRSRRCVIHHAPELRRAQLLRFAADCDVRVRQLERWLGVRHPRPIGVYLFRSAGQKRALMGAAGTNLAKPWRNEIYLQEAGWPHPVLPHELAHVVAANLGRGPFRVAGQLGGLWPDLSLIEGLAVAAVWPQSSRSGMTPHQWTRAMLELDMVPPLRALLGAGFLGQQKRMAYTLSGSLLRFIAETHGAGALHAIYRGGDVAAALGSSLDALERRWHAHVRAVPLPDAGRALVKQRFAGHSVLSAVCPHRKAGLLGELSGLLSAGRDRPAAAVCREILEIDPAEAGTRAALVGILTRLGEHASAEAELSRLREDAAPGVVTAARQLMADEAWRAGRVEQARALYEALLAEPNDRDARRQIEVKALALAAGGRQAALIFDLLVGEPGAGIDGAVAVHLMRELRAERADGLPHYLEARQLYFRERYAEAARLFAQARALGLPTRGLEVEALRVEAICRSALGVEPDPRPAQAAQARALWWALERAPDVDLALQAEAADWRRWLALHSRR